MPCKSITEKVSVTIDHDDRIVDYSLTKVTCGGSVAGRGLIRDLVKHESPEYALAVPLSRLDELYTDEDQLRQFLRQKHLVAIQALLSAYLGIPSELFRDHCKVEEVVTDESATTVMGRIDIDAITDEIKACGNCDSCG